MCIRDRVYRLKDNIEEISNVRFGYTGRFVDDNFKATEYNLTVEMCIRDSLYTGDVGKIPEDTTVERLCG